MLLSAQSQWLIWRTHWSVTEDAHAPWQSSGDSDSAWHNINVYTTPLTLKKCYIRDRLGKIWPIIVKAYVLLGLNYDLLSVKGLNKYGYRVIHDSDPEESGVYAIINMKMDKSNLKSFLFTMSEHSICFNLNLEQMWARQFEKRFKFEFWYWRLGRASIRNIRDTIIWANDLEYLKNMTFETHVMYTSCMIGKKIGGFSDNKEIHIQPTSSNTYGFVFMIS